MHVRLSLVNYPRIGAFASEMKGKLQGRAVLSTEGRVVGPCWEKLKPKGPKGRADP